MIVHRCLIRLSLTPSLRQELEPLSFLVGHCWEGLFPGGGGTDTHCFASVYNGMHVRDTHMVTGTGSLYAGETLFYWDGDKQQIRYLYWNSLGGVSLGVVNPDGDRIAFPDESYTAPDGSRVAVETYWQRLSDEAYDSLTIEKYPDGSESKRRVRYERTSARHGQAPVSVEGNH